jgi:hypothetical protein
LKEDVGRLQVAMHDAVQVGVVDRPRDGRQQRGRFARGLGFA